MKPNLGLTQNEAARRLAADGPNEITQRSVHSAFDLLLGQFKSPLVVLLLVATAISLALGDVLEGTLIFAIVTLNAVLGFMQEHRAEKALEALKKITVSTVRIIRDGVQSEIDSKLLVVGDTIVLEEGNKVPADSLLLESIHLEVDESALTGESMPVEKDANNEENQSVFLGTTITRGRCTAQVTATGMNTKFGKIAASLEGIKKEETPLEKKLQIVAKQLGLIALFAAIIIIAIGFVKGFSLLTILLTAISLAVAAVPEGLPAVITVTLAVGTQRMAKKKAILRKLAAIEALGSITVIATDKTGTLTKNQMRVTRVWVEHTGTHAQNVSLTPSTKTLQKLVATGVFCNNASLAPVKDHGTFDVIGDKTEGALLLLANQLHQDINVMRQSGSLLEEFAFDATRKTMSVVWKDKSGTNVYTKGAPEAILARSTRIAVADGERDLSHTERAKIVAAFESFAKDGLRLIALATKKIEWKNQSRDTSENNLTFLGFVGISDPPRAEVPDAIRIAREAGIRTIMITGDNELTAFAIAKHIALVTHGDEVLTGAQFEKLSQGQKREKIEKVAVFARTTPEQKLEIVKLLQESGHIVAVTGDGVNDALALKQANVGVAMGITGTDVAKEAAEMIVTDDNYATIVSAVEEGRIIYDNMKASIKYLIGSNIGEIIALVGGTLLGWPFILLPIQILYINLITDGLPALALALNSKHHNIMHRTPRTEKHLFTKYDIRWLGEVSTLTAATTLVGFWVGWHSGSVELARTLAFVVIALAQQYIFFDVMAGDRTMFSAHILRNRWVAIPVLIMAMQIALAHTPIFRTVFQIIKPHAYPLLISVAICSVMVVFSEVRKRFLHRFFYGKIV